jgi:N-acetylglucosamine-6-phosphate deacetylase
MLTVAPERLPAEAIRELTRRGVIVCAGHTAATYDETRAALDAGLRGFTHLFNAMSPLTSREPGVVGAALDDRESACGIVVDGFHVHPASLRIAIAAKRRGKMFLVSDAMPPVGGMSQTYELGGVTVTCRNGRCETPDGVIAGSALDMMSAVRNAVATLGVDVAEAARMASTYPADFLGIAPHGRIAAGARAAFVVVDRELRVREVVG